MDNDKWVWADEEEVRPQAIPLFDGKLTPIIEWADVEASPPAPLVPHEAPVVPSETRVVPNPAQ
jgi:hypothetical protein